MNTNILRQPFEYALWLIWGSGLLRMMLAETSDSYSWLFAMILAGFVTIFMAGYFRQLQLLPIAVGLFAMVWLAFLWEKQWWSSHLGMALALMLYVNLLWSGTMWLLAYPKFKQGLALLNFQGNYTEAGGKNLAVKYIHWTAMILMFATVIITISEPADHALYKGLTISLAMLFLFCAGQYLQQELHSYLLLGFAAFLVLVLSLKAGIYFVVFANIYLLFRYLLPSQKTWGLDFSLYQYALPRTAVALTLIASIHPLIAVLVPHSLYTTPFTTTTLILIPLTLFASNYYLKKKWLTFITVSFALWSMSWLIGWWGMDFVLYLWQVPSTKTWLIISIMAWLLSNINHLTMIKRSDYYQAIQWHVLFLIIVSSIGAIITLSERQRIELSHLNLTLVFIILTAAMWPFCHIFGRFISGWRGLSMAIFASLAWGSVVLWQSWWPWAIWAVVLWFAQNFVLAKYEKLMEVKSFSLLGAGLILASSSLLQSNDWMAYVLFVLVYLILLLRNFYWVGLPILIGIGLFVLPLVGIYSYLDFELYQSNWYRIFTLITAYLLWLNLLWWLIPLESKWQAVLSRWGWQDFSLKLPIVTFSITLLVALPFGILALIIEQNQRGQAESVAIIASLLLLFSFWRWQTQTYLNAFIGIKVLSLLTVFILNASIWQWFGGSLLSPLFWVASAIFSWGLRQYPIKKYFAKFDLELAIYLSFVLTWICFILSPSSWQQIFISLVGLMVVSILMAISQQKSHWLWSSAIIMLLLLHAWPLLWVDTQYIPHLWSLYSLEIVGLAWGLYFLPTFLPSFQKTQPLLLAIAIIEWLAHLMLVVFLYDHGQSIWHFGWIESGLAVIAITGFACFFGWQWLRSDNSQEVTESFTLISSLLLIVYLRLLWLGLQAISVWDTAMMMVMAYLLLALQHWKPIANIWFYLLPILAVASVPIQLASMSTTIVLITVAVFYGFLNYHQEQPSAHNFSPTWGGLPFYFALFAINMACYLWIPIWVQQTNLLQMYLIPVSLSVLLLAHLHRQELKSNVLMATRLLALSVFYASATLDVFLQQQFLVFLLALGISFLGIIIGIALRIKIFLYTGTAFLVLNVLGQLIQFYPEQRLAKAFVLMGLGVVITAGMIGFQIKKEQIMQKIRIIRADLAEWD